MTDDIKPLLDEISIKDMIHEIRGQKVILDFDLARIYGYETKRINEQVKRNKGKFPSDFMFQLTKEELVYLLRPQFVTINVEGSSSSNQINTNNNVSNEILKSQNAKSSQIIDLNVNNNSVKSQIATSRKESFFAGQEGGTRWLPYAFTEQGVYMLMTVLKGEYATQQSIALIRAFQLIKNYLVEEGTLSISATEAKLDNHERRLIKLEDKIDLFASSFANLDNRHYFISKNQRIEADMIYQ